MALYLRRLLSTAAFAAASKASMAGGYRSSSALMCAAYREQQEIALSSFKLATLFRRALSMALPARLW